ncbi:type IV pilin protein [Romboutsia ilealis]|uniref:type IV pilin protein n=1 Tax=Romboutsia ilealis TaxID=1115758 RepID=UPI002495209D|nr:prepilin-type N-terminal cleavage/methylation domain-containing protein [Romboutsia ilealis]
MLNKKKNNKGFTLVELLVVIAIIGILAVVAVPALFKNIEKGKVAELESDISAIRSAALSYYADNGTYPNETLTGANASTTSKLLKEIEGLSNPFDATYTVGSGGSGNPVAPPSPLTLTINASKLSADGLAKLKSDLGDDMINSDVTSVSNITVTIISGN